LTAITLFRGEKGLLGLESLGHSDCGFEGEDVICAAVSTLVHALFLGLRDVAGIPVEWEADASVPVIRLMWPESEAAGVRLLTETVALSLREIASRYAGHVSISEVYES
jgi:uncharacterized protein YsxB (DUF464 family)